MWARGRAGPLTPPGRSPPGPTLVSRWLAGMSRGLAGRGQVAPGGAGQPGNGAGDQRRGGRVESGSGQGCRACRCGGQDPQCQAPGTPVADSGKQARGAGGVQQRKPGLNGEPPASPCDGSRGRRKVGNGLAAAEPGPQRCVGRGGNGKPLWVAAVFPVRVRGGGNPAPRGADLVVGEAGPRRQAKGGERAGSPRSRRGRLNRAGGFGHGGVSGPNASSSSAEMPAGAWAGRRAGPGPGSVGVPGSVGGPGALAALGGPGVAGRAAAAGGGPRTPVASPPMAAGAATRRLTWT